MELALHTFNNGRYRFVGLLPIGSAELHASEGPICIKARLWRDALDDHANKGFASRLSFLGGFSYRRLQGFARNQTSVVGRFDREHRVVNVIRFYLTTNVTFVVGTIGQRLGATRAGVKYYASQYFTSRM
jgi:hypothetical protein